MDETNIPKSLADEILDEMFSTLEQRKEFDAPTIYGLRQLVDTEEIKKAQQVIKVIKLSQNENL